MKVACWSTGSRADYLQQLEERVFDVLIVGGGITGAGIFRDCGLQGISAALIEKDDFAFGTSSKSTKLAHGGLRYILNGEFGLVREETHERDWLRRSFPNLVRPVPIIFPNYNRIRTFLAPFVFLLYEALAGWRNYRFFRPLSRRKIFALEPRLSCGDIESGIMFYECVVDDQRLTIEVMKEGVWSGGTALNYVMAMRVVEENGRVAGVEVRDRETGREFMIKARNVVSAVGSWTDQLLPKGYHPSGTLIRPSKGVHVVFKKEDVGNEYGIYATSRTDKRGVFIVSHGEYTYVGTTDTEYNEDLDHCRTDENEYSYLKEITKSHFPSARFEKEDVLGSYAGTRPLVKQEGVSEHKTSRKAFIDMVYPGFFIIAGGKLTTFRAMSQQLLRFMKKHGADSIGSVRGSLSRRKFNVGMKRKDWDEQIKRKNPADVLPDRRTLDHLYENYGSGAFNILERLVEKPELSRRITEEQPHMLAELDYAIDFELVTHVKDFLMRRTNLSLHSRDAHAELGGTIAEYMAKRLGWNKKRMNDEVDEYCRIAMENSFFLHSHMAMHDRRN
ncbi:MAG: glycerol-3-phosphate dehydrogenase/oxidase [Spirochaetes bacterium]|nr:glycerol-3-phosphate dehydrogenase/oxidase [Spirochaetota bacterium]